MGNEVNDEVLSNAFKKYPSFFKAKIVKDKRTLKSKGFGFVSLTNVDDYIKAMREM
jgi:RNA recognition motif-containing protein